MVADVKLRSSSPDISPALDAPRPAEAKPAQPKPQPPVPVNDSLARGPDRKASALPAEQAGARLLQSGLRSPVGRPATLVSGTANNLEASAKGELAETLTAVSQKLDRPQNHRAGARIVAALESLRQIPDADLLKAALLPLAEDEEAMAKLMRAFG